MLRLITFLSNNRSFILFLFLEFIALNLIVRFNDHQRHMLGDAMLEFTGGIQFQGTKVNNYFNLREENIQLNSKIASLEEALYDKERELERLHGVLAQDTLKGFSRDSLDGAEIFQFIPCQAVKSTTNRTYNYITLNKGEKHGIKKGMGLVSSEGIAGRVIHTSKNFSLAQSALNVSFALSTEIEGLGSVGLYEWGTKKSGKAYVSHIPSDLELRKGLLVVTSGNSTVFPQGYKIGTIVDPEGEIENGARRVELKLNTDFRNLGFLYLVPALHKEEVVDLEEEFPQGEIF